jgi:hypothetical protein
MNSDNDMPDITDDDVIVGGGPAEGEDATVPMPNPDAVHPDYKQTVPGAPAPAAATEEGSAPEPSSDDS